MVSPNPLDPTLGASKVTMELSTALNALDGVQCNLYGPEAVGTMRRFSSRGWAEVNAATRAFVRDRAEHYDVVDIDHEHLPFPRSDFSRRPLLVARSVLLVHHLERIRFPQPMTARLLASRLRHGPPTAWFQHRRIAGANATIAAADLVNVSNHADKAELVRRGVSPAKIVVLPFGLTQAQRDAFRQVEARPSPSPVIAFVGSFDFRKGAADFPGIFASILACVPEARLALFGTAGHFRTADQVRALFPSEQRHAIDIHPTFDPATLPALLARCTVGMFPSYCEGFGFGVLEMLAAGLPVVAYDAPGPPEMLEPGRLVPPGDTGALAAKVLALLADEERLTAARMNARQTAAKFDWMDIARRTVALFAEHAERHRQSMAAASGQQPDA